MIRRDICEETPIELILNGKSLVTFMCTPQNLIELSTGYLYSRGLIDNLDDILSNGACKDMRKIIVERKGDIPKAEYDLAGVLSSACGSGIILKHAFRKAPKVKSKMMLTQEKLGELSREMMNAAILYKETGGVHCAGLADDRKLITWYEDIGRHNAVDKVLGKSLFLNLDLSNHILISTGRLSSDMLLKAVITGVPLVVSRSIPSTMAVDIAKQQGITLVGRVNSRNPVIYTHPWRVLIGESRDEVHL